MAAKKTEVDLSEFMAPLSRLRCNVVIALEKLDGERLEKVKAALTSPEVRHDMIAKRLSEWTGIRVSDHSVGRHRRKKCACE